MALKVDKTQTHHRTLKDPDDGTEYGVEYRKLSYGDIEERRKQATRTKRKGKKVSVSYDKKAADYWTVRRAIVSWDVPFEPTPEELDDTADWLLGQVFRHIAELNPSLATELLAFDSDEDEEDILSIETEEDDSEAYDEAADNIAAVKANGHADEDQEQVFSEDEGPTLHAATS